MIFNGDVGGGEKEYTVYFAAHANFPYEIAAPVAYYMDSNTEYTLPNKYTLMDFFKNIILVPFAWDSASADGAFSIQIGASTINVSSVKYVPM